MVTFLSIVIFVLLASNVATYVLYKEAQRRADYLEQWKKSRLYGQPHTNF